MMIAAGRRLVAAGLLACLAAWPATFARAADFNDIWWVPTESGWGVNIAHQNNLLFLTFYIFAADGKPTWITALLTRQGASSNPPVTFTGQTFVSTGTFYGSPWSAANVSARAAGTATFIANTVTTGTLTYSVDGVTVTKQIERYAFNPTNLAGSYIGSIIVFNFNCSNPVNNGAEAASGSFQIAHTPAQQVTITTQLSTGVAFDNCTYRATYSQAGSLGMLSGGTYTCSSGDAGTFSAFEIEVPSQGGVIGRLEGRSTTTGCSSRGGFGGLPPPQ